MLEQKVYDYLRQIPIGKVVTYGQIANYLGNKNYARVIGNILHKNPDPLHIPCYKVVDRNGKLATSFAFGGLLGQQERLEKEGVVVTSGKVDLSLYQWIK